MMSRRVALTGASGTGKTTLMQFIVEKFGLEVNPVGSRSVSQAMGFASPYDVDKAGKRAEFQYRLLKEKTDWEATRDDFVTDRTPFDNLVYSMLHDVHSLKDDYLLTAANGFRRYTHVFYCPFDAFCEPGTDPARVQSKTYQELYDFALWGILDRYAPKPSLMSVMAGETSGFITLFTPDLEARQRTILQALE